VPGEGAGSGDGTNKSERKTPRNKRLPLLDPDWEDVVLEVQSELPGLEDSANPTSAGARAGGAGLSSPGKSPAPKLGGKGGVGRPAGVSGGSAGARSVGGPLQPKVVATRGLVESIFLASGCLVSPHLPIRGQSCGCSWTRVLPFPCVRRPTPSPARPRQNFRHTRPSLPRRTRLRKRPRDRAAQSAGRASTWPMRIWRAGSVHRRRTLASNCRRTTRTTSAQATQLAPALSIFLCPSPGQRGRPKFLRVRECKTCRLAQRPRRPLRRTRRGF
jgi:hypothetical protein